MTEAIGVEDGSWNIAIYDVRKGKKKKSQKKIFNWWIGRKRGVYKKIEEGYQRGSRKNSTSCV